MSGVTLEEYMESMEVKPDGFKLTLVYWGREPADTAHPLHMLLEMLKHQFDMEVKSRCGGDEAPFLASRFNLEWWRKILGQDSTRIR